MPERDSQSKPELSLDARKRLLLVACTIDRLHLMNTWRRPAPAQSMLGQVANAPWMDLALQFLPRLLPRKLRFLLTLLRTWGLVQQQRRP
jgi:hypothetical protein